MDTTAKIDPLAATASLGLRHQWRPVAFAACAAVGACLLGAGTALADPIRFTGTIDATALPAGPAGPPGPQGPAGPAPRLSIGTVETLPPGEPGWVTIEGEPPSFILNFGLPVASLQDADRHPSPPDDNWVLRWEMAPATFVANANKPSPGTVARAKLGTAPDGTPAVEILARAGEPNDLVQYRWYPGGDKDRFGVERIRVSVEAWFEEGSEFGKASGKFPLGVWIGEVAGSSFPTGERSHLNVLVVRPTATATAGFSAITLNLTSPGFSQGKIFGPKLKNELPLGRWIKMVLTVQLNTPGKTDGWYSLELYDGRVKVDETRRTGVSFRNSPDVKIDGPFLVDMWGGPYDHPSQFPPKTQKSWWRDWRFEVPAN
jgi:hypothetical protein